MPDETSSTGRDSDPRAESSEAGGGEEPGRMILLVEDEDTVRKVIERLLVKLGYGVVAASDAEEAIDLFDELDEVVDLVLTDVVMPGLTGVEMARVLKRRRPDVKFLFTSGYTSKELGGSPQAPPEPFLPKPFSMEELSRSLREALDS
ncbi:MAG: response regulator [Gemmatimonadetes bacterium]|nr:response regulator [Gemmatimonadota bacterium]